MDLKTIRNNYPITRNDIFLNHAATSPISKSAISRVQGIASEMDRPLSEHFYNWLNILEDTRRRIAELINVHPTEIAFCQNTSTGLSLIANAISFKQGDRILVPRDEFPSNIYVWQNLQKKGVELSFFDVEPGIPVVETLKKVDLLNVRLISISSVNYSTGRLYDIAAIVKFCHENGILVCCDAIQGIGATTFDAKMIRPDFVACGAQKWLLGSIGLGFIYAPKQWIDRLSVPLVGWASVKYAEDFQLKELDFSADMTRFEPGLPNILPVVALNQSLRELSAIGWDIIYDNIKNNTDYLAAALEEYGINTLAHSDNKAGIVSFTLPESFDLESILKKFKQHKIHITQRYRYIRVSPHFYSTKDEMDIFLSALNVKAKYLKIHQSNRANLIVRKRTVLLTGATGVLGQAFANIIAEKGFDITLVSDDVNRLKLLKSELTNLYCIEAAIESADFSDSQSMLGLLQRLKDSDKRYDALINCAGIAESDQFISLAVEKFKDMLQVNCVAAFQLMQLFLNEIKTEGALGILNIVSASGRCGRPLLSGYAASNAALWSLGEVLARELIHDNSLTITTYVAPPMHSRMQKRLGRVALRYFALKGGFPYKNAPNVAREAWSVFTNKRHLHVSTWDRLILLVNTLLPGLIARKIKKVWRQ